LRPGLAKGAERPLGPNRKIRDDAPGHLKATDDATLDAALLGFFEKVYTRPDIRGRGASATFRPLGRRACRLAVRASDFQHMADAVGGEQRAKIEIDIGIKHLRRLTDLRQYRGQHLCIGAGSRQAT
jgi:hypothetical protein